MLLGPDPVEIKLWLALHKTTVISHRSRPVRSEAEFDTGADSAPQRVSLARSKTIPVAVPRPLYLSAATVREIHTNALGTPDSIFWSISSTECGEMPSSANPGIPGDDTVSICISST